MQLQWSDRCEDPRVAPHLQSLADLTFAYLVKTAIKVGVPVAAGLETRPFDMCDEGLCNTFKECIAGFLVGMCPPPD
jgi:hypothetical protein